MSDPHTHVRTHLLSRSSESQLKCYNEDTDLPVPFNVIASSILLNGNPISTSAGLGSGILSLNNTWTGTNTFNNTVTVATNQTTSFSNTMIVNTNLTSATETTFTTSGNPSGVPACSLGGSYLAGSYALTASASSGAMGMNLGPFTYAINGMYYPTFVGLRGSVTNIIYYVYQYNTAGTAYVQIGGGIALTTSGQTISTEFQANSYSSYQGKIVFYFQGTGVAQSVTFTSFSMKVGRTQLNGLLQLSYNPSTPTYTLGIDENSQVIMYANPVSSIFSGSVSPAYIPYASSANGFVNSIMSQSGSQITITGSLYASGRTQLNGLLQLSYYNPSTPTYTLGVDADSKVIMYANPVSSIFSGSVSPTYIPYASSANGFANSIMSQTGSQITIDGSLYVSGATNKITQAYNALTTDTTTLVNRQTLDSAILSASLLSLGNTWSGTNSFSNTVSLTSVATAAASFTLGLNASNQIVKYSGIAGSVTANYIPYASSANTLGNSIMSQSGSQITIDGSLYVSGATNKITQAYNALTTDTTTLVNRQTLDSAISNLLSLSNTWSGTNSFSSTVSLTSVATDVASFTLGLNASNQIVKYSGIAGSVTTGYVPYASSANTLGNSIMSQSGSQITIDGSLLLTGATNKIIQAYNALTTDTTTLVNRQTLDSAISSASRLSLSNTWSGTNSFSSTVSLTSVATDVASFTLGLNAGNQIVKYSGIAGSVTANYIPYASSANTLGNSIMSQSGSQITIAGSLLLTGATNKITQAYNALTTDTTTLVNRQTLDSAILSASLLSLGNTWSGTNSFSNTVSLTSVATAAASFTLGLNASNQIVKYTASSSGIGGSVTTGYIPYASAANTLADSLLYKSGNNTGIGTTSPAGRFTIYATSAADADRLTSLIVNTYRAGIRLTSNATAGCDWNFWVSTAGESPPQDALCFYNQGTSQFKMVLTRNGALGIGTDNPLCSLYVFSSATTGWAGQSYFGNSTTGVVAGTYDNVAYLGGHNGALSAWKDLAINPNGGNVGIGTTDPQKNKLAVYGGNSVSGISLGDYNITALKYIGITALNDGTNTATNSGFSGLTFGPPNDGGTEGYLGFHTHDYGGGSGERMRITKTGLVGIGTLSPENLLTVKGVIQVTDAGSSQKYAMYSDTSIFQLNPRNSSGGYSTDSFSMRSNGNIGLGRITADLCRVESQTSTLTACSSFYIAPGPPTTFYPVVFNTNPAHDTGQNTYKITIARTSVHLNATWHGSLMAEFWGNSSMWGNGADFFSYQIEGNSAANAIYNYFVGNASVDFTSGWLVVWLRGSTTYYYSCKGASLIYYPSSSPFVSYTIPVGIGTVVSSTDTATAPFDNTFVQYDGVSGLTNFGSTNGGQFSSRLNNRAGGGVELYGTNGGFSTWAATPASGRYTNSIFNGVNVATWNITSWDSQGFTLFCNTSIPANSQAGLGIGSTNYNSNYIVNLRPGINWMNLYIASANTYMYCYGSLAGYFTNTGYVNVSDMREKEDIKDLRTSRSLERIMACKPKYYKRKVYEKDKDGKDTTPIDAKYKDKIHIGLLAQDIMGHNPHCVSQWKNEEVKECDDDDGMRLGVNYNDYIIHLIGSVQEQQKKIETLTEQLTQSQQEFNDYKKTTEARFDKLVSILQALGETK